mgnify:FL=1
MMTIGLDGMLHLSEIQTNSCLWSKSMPLIKRRGPFGIKVLFPNLF